MVLQVGVKALKQRRSELRVSADSVQQHNSQGDDATVGLLLFYAAECGLKERLLFRRAQRDTTALEPTHDLRLLAKELRLSRPLSDRLDRIQNCRLHAPGNKAVCLSDLHQAWRYGVKVHASDEKEAQTALRALITWCEQDER